MLRALICSRYRPYHSHALDCVWQLREAILVLLLRCFLKEPYSAEALGQLKCHKLSQWSWRFSAGVTTTSSPRSSAATPRVASRRRCPRRKSWARMETAWRTVPHLLLQAQRAKASPTPEDPSLRTHTSLWSPWPSVTRTQAGSLWPKSTNTSWKSSRFLEAPTPAGGTRCATICL